MNRDSAEIARKHSYPLYTSFDGKDGINGSSVLLASAEQFYLLTARHVGIESGEMKLFGHSERSPFDDFLTLPECIDISIVKIKYPEFFIENGFSFLPINQWGINTAIRPRENDPHYFVMGYPFTKTKRELIGRSSTPVPFGFWTRAYGQEEQDLIDCPSLTHLALPFLPNKLYDEKRLEYRKAPDLRGMSGGGVWDTSHQKPLLVGILTEQFPNTNPVSLIATRIDAISEVLRNIGDKSIPTSERLTVDVKLT